MSCFVQCTYHLAEGSWDEQREALGDTVIETLAEYAPTSATSFGTARS